jgi:uncharacterized protein YdeI (BOF family)
VRGTVLIAAGALFAAAGCGAPAEKTLGAALAPGEVLAVDAARSSPAGTAVLVSGEMVEKCPVAGCWFVMRDSTGAMRVDTKNAGFVVLDVPLRAKVTVAGKLSKPGDEPQIDASGLRY